MHSGSARTPASPCPQENLNIMLHLRAVRQYSFQKKQAAPGMSHWLLPPQPLLLPACPQKTSKERTSVEEV